MHIQSAKYGNASHDTVTVSLPNSAEVARELPQTARPLILPLQRVAFGLGVGVVGAASLALLTAYHTFVSPDSPSSLSVYLIGNNFAPGVQPTALGCGAALLWGFAYGFLTGWVMAWLRNTMVSVRLFLAAARARASASRTVLDDLM